MEADWDELSQIALPPPGPHALPTSATTVAFDTHQDLLWAGNDFGRVSSFFGPELQRYTSYRAHSSGEGPVKQLLFCDKGVLSISVRSVHLATRRGLTLWHLTHDGFKDLRCMSFTSKGIHEILVAGCQDTMYRIDVERGTIVDTLAAEHNFTLMKKGGQYICAATKTGLVVIIDPFNFRVVKTWQAHKEWINDMDAKADFLVTCGYSRRQMNNLVLDPFAYVYDLKTLLPLPPIPFHVGAAFVRMHPRMSTTSIVASQSGQLQVVDLMNPNTANVRQVNLYDTYLTSLEMAPSGEALALSDALCTVRIWGSPTKVRFTDQSQPTEFPDHVIPPQKMDWSMDTPLSTVGMPYYRETLLSAWPSHLIFEVGAPPPKVDPQVQASLKRAELGHWAPNPRKTKRNQVVGTRLPGKGDSIMAPKFLSEKARDNSNSDPERRMSETLEAMTDLMLDGTTKKDVPVMYRNVEIKYSKFGVDDFDFKYYNKTEYSGLETHIANSYANPLLQLLRFIPLLRNLALHHTSTSCLFENCLLCELGFLIDMLEKAQGQNCQATNFLKTFSNLSNAASLGLLEEHSPNNALTNMIQALNRFLLDKLTTDFRQMTSGTNHLELALTTNAIANIRCAQCNNETRRPGATFAHELVYPPKNSMKNHMRASRPTFSQILKASVERQDQNRGWCDRCKRYQQLAARKSIQNIPPIIMINAAIHSHEAKQLWATPNWMPQKIGIIVNQGQFFCYEGQDLEHHLRRNFYDIQVYELVGVVADINSGENQKSHLVSMINVSPSSRDSNQTESQWHLFNDFLVRSVTKEEALRFEPTWKLPSVLGFQSVKVSHHIDDTWKERLDTSLLYRTWGPGAIDSPGFKQLDPSEHPSAGWPVAIDAEFVSLQREEIEISASGQRETIRPSRLGLARVSVLRGDGPDEGAPFIDDYIAINEPIVDYLTLFSGISPGDLDRSTSKHALVGLKVAYKKLWLLLNLGCVFIGHGLPKDFRTINIHVPRLQVVDTVDLYYIPARQRKLSLRFLAWIVLQEDVQTGTHDSVEDARTALKLWKHWRHVELDEGRAVCEDMVKDIYKRGWEVGFKVPGGGSSTSRMATPARGASGTPDSVGVGR
ncbi:PAB-dependent poly(A)-specific ribonuclease subunit PAN2 [Phyllosticta citrichinensis]|uniref:PAN2-PAN3 deadenylation complex catalytic subunit PAN2 n=1 Tax=Phyllosticta citrichinensis TaxID=1130410 RepID=A0ABR1Y807_9PEZI